MGIRKINKDGYLQDSTDWDKEIARGIAQREGVEMTDIHWTMIDFLRTHYHEYGCVPPVKSLRREMEERIACLKWDNKYLEQLYPAGPGRKLCKISGLPKSAGEIENASVLGGGQISRRGVGHI